MTKPTLLLFALAALFLAAACNAPSESQEEEAAETAAETTDPGEAAAGWQPLFAPDLSNADYPEGVWTVEDGGVLTASEDQAIWTTQQYDNFVLDLEFKLAEGTNSGVIVYCSDKENWIPNSVEVQIADDYAEQWAESPPSWQCGAIFGHKPASADKNLKRPGEWNQYQVTCRDNIIQIALNGEQINEIDMSRYTSAETNPDGSEIPEWLSKPLSVLPTKGYIGFQGKHAGAPVWFRNIRIRTLE